MILFRLPVWCCLFLFVAGFSHPVKLSAQKPIPKDTLITLERTICYGSCPDYKLTIAADGTVTFEGRRFVKVRGIATGHISQEDLRKLIAEFDAVSYFSLRDSYKTQADGCPEVWTDNPQAITSIRMGGKSKKIVHYYGCEEDQGKSIYPKVLTELEAKIDQIAGTDKWSK